MMMDYIGKTSLEILSTQKIITQNGISITFGIDNFQYENIEEFLKALKDKIIKNKEKQKHENFIFGWKYHKIGGSLMLNINKEIYQELLKYDSTRYC